MPAESPPSIADAPNLLASDSARLRLIVQQPALAKYRVPVFQQLADQPDIDLQLLYGEVPGLPNVEPAGFNGQPVSLKEWNVLGSPLYWHAAQWQSATLEQADVLMLTWNTRYLSLIPTLLRAKWNGVSTLLWGHAYSKRESRLRRFVRKAVSRLATALLFYNHEAADAFRSEGWPAKRLHVALNSLDQQPIESARKYWQSHPERLAAFREQHQLNNGPMVLYVSRFDPDNRVDLLIQATAELIGEFPNLQVVLIGSANDEQRRLKELAAELGVSQSVRFLGAIYEERELAPWFLSAKVFCYPANIGLSLLHAFGYGVPVVTGDDLASHNPEIEALDDGTNGLFFAHGDPLALASTLRHLINDEKLRQRMGQAALQTIQQRFNLENMVAGMADAVRYCGQQSRCEPANKSQTQPS